MRLAIWVALCAVALGCSSSELTAAGHRVTSVTSALDVSGCESLGDVESRGAESHDPQSRTFANHELRNATAEKGGTHVLVDETNPARGVAMTALRRTAKVTPVRGLRGDIHRLVRFDA